MIIDNKGNSLLNLEESVQWCIDKISDHYNRDRVLADFGIEVIGQVDSAADLEGIDGTKFGEAYLVGTEEPYSFYVWTRPNPPTHKEPYWLDIGPIAIAGPEGATPTITTSNGNIVAIDPETGNESIIVSIASLRGKQGVGVYTYNGINDATPNNYFIFVENGTSAINATNGNVYHFKDNKWVLVGNIRGAQGPVGPQGIQGPQGEQGEQGPQGIPGRPGSIAHIVGQVSSISQLPSPEVINDITAAYAVGTNTPYELYIQMGNEPTDAMWVNVGPINDGTLVYDSVSDEYYNLWDSSTKLDKYVPPSSDHYNKLYGYDTNTGNTKMYTVHASAVANSVPIRNSDGTINVGLTPLTNTNAASKKYVDDNLNKKMPLPTTTQTLDTVPVIGKKQLNVSGYTAVSDGVASGIIVKRDGTGNIKLPEPDVIPDSGNYAVSMDKLLETVTPAFINGITVGKMQTVTGFEQGEYGIYVIKGANVSIEYTTTTGGFQSRSGKIHIIFYYREGGQYDRMVHIYTSGILSAYNEVDAILDSDVVVFNNTNESGARLIKIPMKSN